MYRGRSNNFWLELFGMLRTISGHLRAHFFRPFIDSFERVSHFWRGNLLTQALQSLLRFGGSMLFFQPWRIWRLGWKLLPMLPFLISLNLKVPWCKWWFVGIIRCYLGDFSNYLGWLFVWGNCVKWRMLEELQEFAKVDDTRRVPSFVYAMAPMGIQAENPGA